MYGTFRELLQEMEHRICGLFYNITTGYGFKADPWEILKFSLAVGPCSFRMRGHRTKIFSYLIIYSSMRQDCFLQCLLPYAPVVKGPALSRAPSPALDVMVPRKSPSSKPREDLSTSIAEDLVSKSAFILP